MPNEISPFTALIDLWPSVAALAEDLDEKYPTVAAWKQRGSIPPDRWEGLIAAAAKRQIPGITWESLARIAGGQPMADQKGGESPQPLKYIDVSSASKNCSLSATAKPKIEAAE